jgi:hypothetical protein
MKSGIDHERLVRMTADLEEDEYGLSLRLRAAGGGLSNYGGDNFGFRRSVFADRVEGGSGFHQMFLNIQYSCSRDEFRNVGMPEDTRNFLMPENHERKPPPESIASMMIDVKLAKYIFWRRVHTFNQAIGTATLLAADSVKRASGATRYTHNTFPLISIPQCVVGSNRCHTSQERRPAREIRRE